MPSANPFCAGVRANLAKCVDHIGIFEQNHSIIAIKPASPVGLVSFGKDGRVSSAAVGHHVHIASGHGAREGNGESGAGAAVKIHLNVVIGGGQINIGSRAVVDFYGLVVAAAFNIFRDK